MIFIKPRRSQQNYNRNTGKMQRLAIFALSYGGSYKTASYVSGLGLRRVKVIAKQLRRF